MAFRGCRVFVSRNLISSQLLDAVHDALKQNGAEICFCCNPTCNAPSDFHVLESPHAAEKLEELLANGCQIIGPQCILYCAKKRLPFPKQRHTCCFAMEGIRVLATGFQPQEKAKIEQMVASMCGTVDANVSPGLSFVVAKNVLTPKYKLASKLRKHIVTIDWLNRCWYEHRIVPHEPFRLSPFCGLMICATQIPAGARSEIAEAITTSGGIYSADLTKSCTHLIANSPIGEKHRVAKVWGTVKIVNVQWLWASITAKASLDEEMFPVRSDLDHGKLAPNNDPQEPKQNENFHSSSSAPLAVSETANFRQSMISDSHGSTIKTLEVEQPVDTNTTEEEEEVDADNDMYLSNCRFYLVGFTRNEMRKLVDMVRDGGGTRYIEFNKTVTHVILGKPSESELKLIKQDAIWGAMHVLNSSWLDDCTRKRREVTIMGQHKAHELLYPSGKQSAVSRTGESNLINRKLQQPSFSAIPNDTGAEHKLQVPEEIARTTMENLNLVQCKKSIIIDGSVVNTVPLQKCHDANMEAEETDSKEIGTFCVPQESRKLKRLHSNEPAGLPAVSSEQNLKSWPLSGNVFAGLVFDFADTFPAGRREEIIHLVLKGGGRMRDGAGKFGSVDFLIGCHGFTQNDLASSNAKLISSHWLYYCLEEGKILNIDDHVLYRPLTCDIPIPGFENLRFCISQYEGKERTLSHDLCRILGSKFTEILNKKVTHLLCKFADGEKYKAALSWNIKVVSCNWLSACISQNKIIPTDPFMPKEPLSAGLDISNLPVTQYPSQAVRLATGELGSQWVTSKDQGVTATTKIQNSKGKKAGCTSRLRHGSRLQEKQSMKACPTPTPTPSTKAGFDPWDELTTHWSSQAKKSDFCDGDAGKDMLVKEASEDLSLHELENVPIREHLDGGITETTKSQCQSDVAAAIENLLAQTSKSNNVEADGVVEAAQDNFASGHVTLERREQTVHYTGLKPSINPSRPVGSEKPKVRDVLMPDIYDGFDDSQMDSQVVGYDEDQPGRQVIMERVRTRSLSGATVPRRSQRSAKITGLSRLFKAAEANK